MIDLMAWNVIRRKRAGSVGDGGGINYIKGKRTP